MHAVEPATDVSGEPLIGCFGFLNMNKRIPELLEAFAAFRRTRPGARLLLVGAAGERFDVQRRLERLGLTEGVERLDYVPEERLWSLMAACDVLVNLRYPTMGETSGSVIRALSLGKPLVVSDVGWFSELPDDAVLKVPVDEREVEVIEAALTVAADHGPVLGAAARAYVEREHDLGKAADGVRRGARARGRRRAGRRRRALARRRGGRRDRHHGRRGSSRLGSARSASVRSRVAAVPGWAWLTVARARLLGGALPVRAPHGRAVDHDRRDRLLGAREELRGDGSFRGARRRRRAATGSSIRS